MIPGEVAAVIKLALSQVDAVWHPLQQLWSGQLEPGVPEVRWWIGHGRLHWEMKTVRPGAVRESFPADGFVEELWKQDVAEFFIADPPTGHYQEYNLSPGGAWWAAAFRAPRVRVDPQPEVASFGVRTEVVWGDSEWIGRISLPQPDLSGAAINFSAILEGEAGRRFYSLALLGGDTPDFHRPEEWIRL